eukprot:CAMPEP_0180273772 /NCGR_PEP_ID=MMETSP0988-20121125/4976_1 /TAXON_ID=697907 /ORGANISM="non described non described, Strain CCMP2293" /LENGTH=68 /DNA_ID=CAMNT_0022244971 /DNA_START=342 /DNA_END=545 /DNA_ORIENTATION=-
MPENAPDPPSVSSSGGSESAACSNASQGWFASRTGREFKMAQTEKSAGMGIALHDLSRQAVVRNVAGL